MIRRCAWCGTDLGYVSSSADPVVTWGICSTCAAAVLGQAECVMRARTARQGRPRRMPRPERDRRHAACGHAHERPAFAAR